MSAPIRRYFTYDHLPTSPTSPMREVSSRFATLALALDAILPDGPEKSAGLRKLLEAKDCAVRAALDIGVPQ